ncbi:MAG: hypothetical protein H0W38_18915 [Methylibium sp.]|nr:hypothetical protein [Methylibium sp.]
MKGMQKISRGATFDGVLRYAFADPHAKFLGTSACMASNDEAGLAAEFSITQSFRTDIKKPVWHQSLRLPDDEIVEHPRQLAIAHDYMARMEFDPRRHQYAVVAHGRNHVHIIASRIDFNGAIWYGRQENLISTRVTQELERLHGLRITRGPQYQTILGARGAPTYRIVELPEFKKPRRREVQRHERLQRRSVLKQPLPRNRVAAILKEARQAALAGTLADFISVAEARGLAVYAGFDASAKPAPDGQVRPPRFTGFVFELPARGQAEIRISGSKVGAAYSGKRILEAIGVDETKVSALLATRHVPFGPHRYLKPVWQLPKRLSRIERNEFNPPVAGLAPAHAFAPGRWRTLDTIPTLDSLHALPGGPVVLGVEGHRDSEGLRLLPNHERDGVAATRATPSAGLRPTSGAGGQGHAAAGRESAGQAGAGGKSQGQAGSEGQQRQTRPSGTRPVPVSNDTTAGSTDLGRRRSAPARANASHTASGPSTAGRPSGHAGAHLPRAQAQALRERTWSERLARIVASHAPGLGAHRPDLETAYLRKAATFLTESRARGVDPDAAGWRAWDLSVGVPLLDGEADHSALLTRLSLGAINSVETIEIQINAGLPPDPVARDYGGAVVRESRHARSIVNVSKPALTRRPRMGR